LNSLINRITKKVSVLTKIGLISFYSKLRKRSAKDQLLIFSDPRGGSTWLAEMINSIPRSAIIWEPLHLEYVHQLRELNFGWRQHIPEKTDWPEVKKLFEKIFKGSIVNEWTMLHSTLSNYISAKILIIKLCRGNMLLPWITRTFDLKYQPIYMVRHPFGVVNSQMKQGGWDNIPDSFEIPNTPFNDFLKMHQSYFKSLNTKEEKLTSLWCLSNTVPLNHQDNNIKWISIYYENLLLKPEQEVQRIFNKWKIPVPEGIEKNYRKESSTTLGRIDTNDPEAQLNRWQRELSISQIDKMQSVLDYFGITCYSRDELIPVVNDSI
jgi:hypothetical protein